MPKARDETRADRAEKRAAVLRLRAENWPRSAIAAHLGMTEAVVKNALEYERAARGEDVRQEAAASWGSIVAEWQRGRSYAEIAAASGLSEAEVRDRIEYARRLGDRGSVEARAPKPRPEKPAKPPRPAKPPKLKPLPRAVDAAAVSALAAGAATKATAAQFGITPRQVRRIVPGVSQAKVARPLQPAQQTTVLDAEDLHRRCAIHGKWKPVAEELGLTLPGLSEAMLRVFGQRPSDWLRGQAMPAAPSAVRSALSTGAFDHLLGKVPDVDVAAQAGVPVDQVARRRYRLRNLGRL